MIVGVAEAKLYYGKFRTPAAYYRDMQLPWHIRDSGTVGIHCAGESAMPFTAPFGPRKKISRRIALGS